MLQSVAANKFLRAQIRFNEPAMSTHNALNFINIPRLEVRARAHLRVTAASFQDAIPTGVIKFLVKDAIRLSCHSTPQEMMHKFAPAL